MTNDTPIPGINLKLDPAAPILDWPLYSQHDHSQFLSVSLTNFCVGNFQIDAFCTECENVLPFKTRRAQGSGILRRPPPGQVLPKNSHFPNGVFKVELYCGRCSHAYEYFFKVTNNNVMKIGQFPSIADISNAETARYRKMMSKEDAAEFYKAVGLAAHGIGVGSYVYLRRIFERMIYTRFDSHKETNEWEDDEFYNSRMDEKIRFLKSYVPPFLFENRKIYSILSKGIHEMSEEECIGYFDILKRSIVMIIEEDKKNDDERKAKADLTAAISKL